MSKKSNSFLSERLGDRNYDESAPVLDGAPSSAVAPAPAPAKARPSKSERFVKLRAPRVAAALKRIAAVTRLADHRSYACSDEQAAQIVSVMQGAVDDLTDAFSGTAKEATGTLWL